MQTTKHIDKTRLMFFSDAILAIIITILVLDIKVPEGLELATNGEFFKNLIKVLPHFFGFIISFAFIIVLWLSHHDLLESLLYANRRLATFNFCFLGATATLPFSTALAAAYSHQPYAVATLALNMFVMNIFLATLHIYSVKSGLRDINYFPIRYQKMKQMFGIFGGFVFLLAIFVSFFSPTAALIIIVIVPILHIIPISSPV
ncbi:MAG: TMEM175 family protein [Saprospiraceae bacterium]